MDDRALGSGDRRGSPAIGTARRRMTENPYLPPHDAASLPPQRYRLFCLCLLCLTSLLAVVVAGAAVAVAYWNYAALAHLRGSVHPYHIAVTVVLLCCSFGLAYSSLQWRRRNIQSGLWHGRGCFSRWPVVSDFVAGGLAGAWNDCQWWSA